MITVTLYVRADCHLCEQAEVELESLQEEYPHRLVLVDVDSEPDLRRAYGFDVPVLEVGPYKLHAPLNRPDMAMTLGAAIDRQDQLNKADSTAFQKAAARAQEMTGTDRLSFWIARHYLLVFNLFLLLYVGLPFLAPLFMKTGLKPAADVIQVIYRPLCHQWGFRSWYLFGEQAFYPHAAAQMQGFTSFEQATGITDANDPGRLKAREYAGNELVGYKVPLCERDVAIWGAMLFFGLLFAVVGRRIPPLHWLMWVLVGLVPVSLDGFSQLFSQLNITWLSQVLPYRESTPLLRTLTGFLFGFTTAWFGFPVVEEVMRDSRLFFIKKSARSIKD